MGCEGTPKGTVRIDRYRSAVELHRSVLHIIRIPLALALFTHLYGRVRSAELSGEVHDA